MTTIDQGTGSDNLTITAGTAGAINQGDGTDFFQIEAGVTVSSLDQSGDLDTAIINGGHIVGLLDNGDYVEFHGGRIGNVDLAQADNHFIMDGSLGPVTIDGFLSAEQGVDRFELTAGTIGTFVNSGSGDDVITLAGTIISGDVLMENGDDTLTWSSGNLANFLGGDGSDQVTILTTEYNGSQALNGGDDHSTADGWTDNLLLQGLNLSVVGTNLTNWENITFDGGTYQITDNALTVGSDAGTGLTISNNAALEMGSVFALTGNVLIDTGSIIQGSGGIAGTYSFSNNVTNNGSISTRDDHAGDAINVQGDYGGSGNLLVDVDFTGNTADRLAINGDVTAGTTTINVNDISTGNPAGTDVLVVDVDGTSNSGDFQLVGGSVSSGAYVYDLNLRGNDWYLATTGMVASTAVYEIYPLHLLGLSKLSTLQQRVGNRFWSEAGATRPESSGIGNGPLSGHNGKFWVQIEGVDSKFKSRKSTTGSDYSTQTGKVRIGVDSLGYRNEHGTTVLGINGFLGTAKSKISSSDAGDGELSSEGYGVGLTATWYGPRGHYLDIQGQYSWLTSSGISSSKGPLFTNNKATGKTALVEAGQRKIWNKNISFTPQAQWTYAAVDFDQFVGPDGELVRSSPEDQDQLTGRVGLATNWQNSWTSASGDVKRQHSYMIANLHYEFFDTTTINAFGTDLDNQRSRFNGEIGIGGTYNWGNDRFSLYGETSVSFNLVDFAESYSLQGQLGLRIAF